MVACFFVKTQALLKSKVIKTLPYTWLSDYNCTGTRMPVHRNECTEWAGGAEGHCAHVAVEVFSPTAFCICWSELLHQYAHDKPNMQTHSVESPNGAGKITEVQTYRARFFFLPFLRFLRFFPWSLRRRSLTCFKISTFHSGDSSRTFILFSTPSNFLRHA